MTDGQARQSAVGDIFWVQLDNAEGEDIRIPHPYVIIDGTTLEDSGFDSVVICALTTNLTRVSMPGNVLLDAGEGNLPRRSIIEVSKVLSIATARLGDYIGTLTAGRITQIEAGRRFLERSGWSV